MAIEKSDKSPAFQFYPRDWDTDDNVTPMTYEEEGVYWALCRRYWLNGNTLPADLDELHSKLKATEGKKRDRRMSKEKFVQIWDHVGKCFKVVDGRLTHKRLDRERAKQKENSAKRAKAAEERWAREESRKQPVQSTSNASASDVQCLASSSASASSIAATADLKTQQQPVPRLWDHPRRADRAHAGHVFGFCEFKCISEEKANEFARDLPRGLDDPKNFERVIAWAQGVKRGWGDKPKLEAEWYRFWEARWKEYLASLQPASLADDAIQRQIAESEARRRSVR
jgi:uncharacterized protein YdaU (DUF1376 family)